MPTRCLLLFPKAITKGSKDQFIVYYSGKPTIAVRAPWDGGVVYKQDSLKKPWVATACEGVGASIWWPNKDHLSDEVDSMLISISVPKGLKDVSNGRLRKVTPLKDGYTKFDWFVANPINNYDVVANIGDYVHFGDTYMGEKGKLTMDYWVLPASLEKAKQHFGANARPMLKAFEHWFGPYPFYEDGYKLVETPHLGMEHQSATAYGNHFLNGYLGYDMSGTGWGENGIILLCTKAATNGLVTTSPGKTWAICGSMKALPVTPNRCLLRITGAKKPGRNIIMDCAMASITIAQWLAPMM
jgi:hypothetical protein